MESYPISQSQGQDDLQKSRSRANSGVSVGESSFQNLNITETTAEIDASSQSNLSSSGPGSSLPSLAPFSSTYQVPPSYLTTSLPQLYAPLPQSAQAQDWPFLEPSRSPATPLVRIDRPEDQETRSSVQLELTSEPESYSQANMSTMGVQYYPRFDPTLSRSSYSWPVFEANEPFPEHNINIMDPFNEPVTLPSYPRSASSSPPQALFTPEQRELKRQRDQARRDSKTRIRRDRSTSQSHSYNGSLSTTPDLDSRSASIYSQSIGADSTIATTSLPLPSQPYLHSPQMPLSASPEMYHAQFPLTNNDFGGGYLMPFSQAPSESSVPSYPPSRPVSMSSIPDLSLYYRHPTAQHSQESPDTVRVVHSRPKPQCWDHGCNGRQFSTFSNLLRHQREKSGVTSKPTCPKCGAEFTRTTARNGHMAHEKCKQRRNS